MPLKYFFKQIDSYDNFELKLLVLKQNMKFNLIGQYFSSSWQPKRTLRFRLKPNFAILAHMDLNINLVKKKIAMKC